LRRLAGGLVTDDGDGPVRPVHDRVAHRAQEAPGDVSAPVRPDDQQLRARRFLDEDAGGVVELDGLLHRDVGVRLGPPGQPLGQERLVLLLHRLPRRDQGHSREFAFEAAASLTGSCSVRTS